MSWADIVRKKPSESSVPDREKQVLIAEAPHSKPSKLHVNSSSGEVPQTAVLTDSIAKSTARILILDTGALLRAHDVPQLGDHFYTIPDVLQEVRDARHRQSLENLTYELTVVTPPVASIQAVIAAATATGDIGSLSRTDLRVLALARQIALERGCLGKLTEVTEQPESETDGEEEEGGEGIADGAQKDGKDEGPSAEATNAGDEEEDEGWITAENLHVHQSQPMGMIRNADTNTSPVACLTVDFAMQNSLLHLGVPVLGLDGRRITRLRTWVLRCHACFTVLHETTRQFCPACGSGNTLRKVSYTIDSDGQRHIWINWTRRLNTRGVRYNLPKPRWGARGTNRTLVLREDQLKGFGVGKSRRQQKDLHNVLGGGDAACDIFGKGRDKRSSHEMREKSSYTRYNVNERRNMKAARKK